jgi:glutamyl-tRNA reductase
VLRARKLLDKGQNIESVLESLSMGMMKKMLNGPLRELNHSDEPQRVKACEAVKQMFLKP